MKVIDLPPHMIEVSDPETKLMANRSWEIDSAEKRLLVLVDESRDLGDRFPSSPVTTVDFIFNLFADPDLKQVESSK